MSKEKKNLICTRCGETKGTYSELVYSQGNLVCEDCKKIAQKDDDAAYDRFITSPLRD